MVRATEYNAGAGMRAMFVTQRAEHPPLVSLID